MTGPPVSSEQISDPCLIAFLNPADPSLHILSTFSLILDNNILQNMFPATERFMPPVVTVGKVSFFWGGGIFDYYFFSVLIKQDYDTTKGNKKTKWRQENQREACKRIKFSMRMGIDVNSASLNWISKDSY